MDQRIKARQYQDRMSKQRERQNRAKAAARVSLSGIPAQPSISPHDSISRYSELSTRIGKMEENMSKFMSMFDPNNPSSPLVNALVSKITSVSRGMNVTVQPGDGSFHPGWPSSYSSLIRVGPRKLCSKGTRLNRVC